MLSIQKTIVSKSFWLLAAFILPLCLVTPAAASSTDLATRANHLRLPSQGLEVDPPDIIIPTPPALPPPARVAVLAPYAATSSTDLAAPANNLRLPSQGLAVDPPDIIIPTPPALPPPARL